jgi:transposase
MTRKRKKKKKKQHQKAQARRGRRYELTDEAFQRIEPLLPTQKPGGQWKDHRTVLNGLFWILNSGAQWRDMPERYGKWKTVYDRYRRWMREGLFDQILNRLHLQLDADGRIDWDVFDVDGSNIRAHQSAAGAAKKGANENPGTTPWDDRAEALARSFIF